MLLKANFSAISALFSLFISRRIPLVADLLVERHLISSSVNLILCLAQARTSAYDASLLFLVIITAEVLRSFLFLAASFFTTFTLFFAVTLFYLYLMFSLLSDWRLQFRPLTLLPFFFPMMLSFMTFEGFPPMARLPFLTFLIRSFFFCAAYNSTKEELEDSLSSLRIIQRIT